MNSRIIFRFLKYFACFVLGALFSLVQIPIYCFVSSITVGKHVQTLVSPDERHTAVLLSKHNLADFNFIVKVDGVKVYESPDLWGRDDHFFREQLIWDKTSRVVVLEIMGKRVFAYNADAQETLAKGQLSGYKFYPMPNDYFCVYLRDIDD